MHVRPYDLAQPKLATCQPRVTKRKNLRTRLLRARKLNRPGALREAGSFEQSDGLARDSGGSTTDRNQRLDTLLQCFDAFLLAAETEQSLAFVHAQQGGHRAILKRFLVR